jgi:hypothetical protein
LVSANHGFGFLIWNQTKHTTKENIHKKKDVDRNTGVVQQRCHPPLPRKLVRIFYRTAAKEIAASLSNRRFPFLLIRNISAVYTVTFPLLLPRRSTALWERPAVLCAFLHCLLLIWLSPS